MTVKDLLGSIPKRKREDAIWLLTARLGINRSALFLEQGRELDKKFLKGWERDWKRRLEGEPLQYIFGFAPFYGREFMVNKKVLIPRPETESLVELCLSLLGGEERAKVLDIGTGSGAIALTLKAERPGWDIAASDISASALSVAKKNAARLELSIDFQRADIFPAHLSGAPLDLVVSNPPYLDFARDKITKEVREWEPKIALEPVARNRISRLEDRATWCAERILLACAGEEVRFTAMELSPRVARALELRWRKNSMVERVWRAPDLAGRKRFLLVAWKNA